MDQENLSYTELLDQLSDGVYLLDVNRRITFWNGAAERMTGFRRDEVVGKRCADNILMHVDESGKLLCEQGCPVAATITDGKNREAHVFLHHRDGHRVPVSVRASPIRDRSDTVVGAIEVFTDATPQKEMADRIAELERLALVDALTGIANRRHLELTLKARSDEFARYGWPFGILMIDVDEFKVVNDTFGHDVGDMVLRMVARTLAHSARVFDVIGRWGGEEFLAVLANTDAGSLRTVGERFRALVEASGVPHQQENVKVTVSMGAALAARGEQIETLVKRADRLLFAAKRSGRNRLMS